MIHRYDLRWLLGAVIWLTLSTCGPSVQSTERPSTLVVAADTPTIPLAEDLLNGYQAHSPESTLTLETGNTDTALASVRAGTANLALVHMEPADSSES